MSMLHYSFIIPVYNRPDEIQELLESFTKLEGDFSFEVVIVEDGSDHNCKPIVEAFNDQVEISYYYKSNSGPGDSRNYGMHRAKGNYFIILDSDCVLPSQYLTAVNNSLQSEYVDCFGGPDAAHSSFTTLQKAINFTMTSFITTGGIRGGKAKVDKFQPRSFNMGLSRVAFEKTKGFGTIHPGEDPDLSIRLSKLGFKTKLIIDAFVYHKRRISWSNFFKQVHKFGLVRPILNAWHPETERAYYWLPFLFSLGLIVSLILFLFGFNWLLILYSIYFLFAFLIALFTTKNIVVTLKSVVAIFIQFFGYGYGFIKSTIAIKLLGKDPKKEYPNLFFEHVD